MKCSTATLIGGWFALLVCMGLGTGAAGFLGQYNGQDLDLFPVPAFLALAAAAFGLFDAKHPKSLIWVLLVAALGTIQMLVLASQASSWQRLLGWFAAAGFAAVGLWSVRLLSVATTPLIAADSHIGTSPPEWMAKDSEDSLGAGDGRS